MMDVWNTVWWVLIGYTTLLRVKYVWQANKIRRNKSVKNVSHKFLLHTHVAYWIQFAHNINVSDLKDQVFWSVGILTTAYSIITIWQFREPKVGLKQWLIESLTGESEGGIWR